MPVAHIISRRDRSCMPTEGKKFHITAIGAGWLIAFAFSRLLGAIVDLVSYRFFLARSGGDPQVFWPLVNNSLPVLLARTTMNGLADFAGGYVCAVLARPAELRNAFAVGIILSIANIDLMPVAALKSPVWFITAGTLLPVPMSLLGAGCRILWGRRVEKGPK